MGVDRQRHARDALPTGKTRYPLYRRLSGPQDRSGQVRKISPPPRIRSRTVQLVASRYPDWAMPASYIYIYIDMYYICRYCWRPVGISVETFLEVQVGSYCGRYDILPPLDTEK